MNNKGIAKSTVVVIAIVIVIIAGIGIYLVIRAPPGKRPGEIWVAMVTDVGGRGDMSFNDMGFRGCDLAKAQGIVDKVTEVISTTPEDYLPNLEELAATGDYDLIIPIGFLLTEATATVAQEYPEQNFACIDFVPSWETLPLTNGTLGVFFAEEQSGALEGVLAGLTAAAYNKSYVSAVFGMGIPPVWAYEIGFKWGLNWSIGEGGWYESKFGETASGIGETPIKERLIYDYTEKFDDPALGKTTAEAQLAHDVATVWGAAGATGLGAFDAVEEYHTAHNIPKNEPPFILGVDADQDWMKPGLVIGSGMKRIDEAVLYICQLVQEGKFKDSVQDTNGILMLGIEDGASGISNLELLDDFIQFGIDCEELTGEQVLPASAEEIKADVEAMRDAQPAWVWEGLAEFESKLETGEITVPRADEEDEVDQWREIFG
jgi:basic membrane protein A